MTEEVEGVMNLTANLPKDTLVQITVDRMGLIIMISAAHKAIQQVDSFNLGDELDTDITPYHDMRDTLIKQYKSVFDDEEYKAALDL
tara:strand:+ start:350 stop:610 length:261 start_codon:yes stop_codon:yes gene_type:complete